MSPPASDLTTLLCEAMNHPVSVNSKTSEHEANENPQHAAILPADSTMILESLPFDHVFVVNLAVDKKTATLSGTRSRFVGSCQGALTTVLTPACAAQVELLCGQETTRKRQVKLEVEYQDDERMSDVWNITLFPIKDKKQKNTISAMGGLVTVEEQDNTSRKKRVIPAEQGGQEDEMQCEPTSSPRSTPTSSSDMKQAWAGGSLNEQTQLFRLLPIAYVMVEALFDPDTNKCIDYRFLDVNQHFESMTGLTKEGVIGNYVTDILPGIEADPADWIGRAGRVVQENWVDSFNSFSLPLNKWYAGVSFWHSGNILITFFVQNHSEKYTLDEALRESEERHRTLFENMTQGVIYHAADGRVTDANQAALRFLGLTKDQILGKEPMDPQWRFVYHDGSTIPVEEYPAVVALQGRRVESMTFGVYNTLVEDINWIKLDAVPRFRPGEDTPYEAYTIFSDMTEEVTMKKRLLRAKEKAEEADQLKSAFLATMSHEIR